MSVIISLTIFLIIIVIVVSTIEHNQEKKEQIRRQKISTHNMIIEETDSILANLAYLPQNSNLLKILEYRRESAINTIAQLKNDNNTDSLSLPQLNNMEDMSNINTISSFTVPTNEQQVIAILQCLKKIKNAIVSEQTKGHINIEEALLHNRWINNIQLKITIETLEQRAEKAFKNEMFGSCRQYYEKAIKTLDNSTLKNQYINEKHSQIEKKLNDLTNQLQAKYDEKIQRQKEKSDSLFEPKKKW